MRIKTLHPDSHLVTIILSTVYIFFSRAFCGGAWVKVGYGILRVITGMGGIGCNMVSFVLAGEHAGFNTALWVSFGFSLGEVILGIEAFFVRDWRWLQILAHLPLLGKDCRTRKDVTRLTLASVGRTEVVGARVTTMVDQQWQAGGGEDHSRDGLQSEQ